SWRTMAAIDPGVFVPIYYSEPAVCAFNGTIYQFGGAGTEIDGRSFRYDVLGNQWKEVAKQPVPTYAARAAVADGRIFVFGGREPASNDASPLNYEFVPATETWIARAPM